MTHDYLAASRRRQCSSVVCGCLRELDNEFNYLNYQQIGFISHNATKYNNAHQLLCDTLDVFCSLKGAQPQNTVCVCVSSSAPQCYAVLAKLNEQSLHSKHFIGFRYAHLKGLCGTKNGTDTLSSTYTHKMRWMIIGMRMLIMLFLLSLLPTLVWYKS